MNQILSVNFKNLTFLDRENSIPEQTDILVIGGGLTGWSIAYWLRNASKTTVTLVERDPSYSLTSSLKGFGGLRHQFYSPEYIEMGMFSFDFLRNINDFLQVNENHKIDVNFAPHGHLMLTTEKYEDNLMDNFHLQQALGVSSQYLYKDEINEKWPWLNTKDVAAGSFGLDYEGWFDSGKLLKAFQEKGNYLGVNYVIGQVEELEKYGIYQSYVNAGHFPERAPIQYDPVRFAHVRTQSGTLNKITFGLVINCAGCWTNDILRVSDSRIDNFPVEKALQHVYIIRPPEEYSMSTGRMVTPSIDSPFIFDSSGLIIQRIGLTGNFAVYKETTEVDIVVPAQDFKMIQNCNRDFLTNLYNENIKSDLVNRIPCMEKAQIVGGWSCLEDYNRFDNAPVIGQHPFQPKMFLACGANTLGAPMSIAIGRAMSELIFYSMYRTVDLSCFSPHRLLLDLSIEDNKIRD